VTTVTGTREQVVLLGADRQPVGVADKAGVHTADTPLHLAFSCYVLDGEGRLLMTRRALGKATWPGVWTNSACGHPAPGEDPVQAVHRRVRQELGLELDDVRPVLPDFAYRATDAGGVVENEVCPVYLARADADPVPDPDEVAQWHWADAAAVVAAAAGAPWLLSPWSVLQLAELHAAGHLGR